MGYILNNEGQVQPSDSVKLDYQPHLSRRNSLMKFNLLLLSRRTSTNFMKGLLSTLQIFLRPLVTSLLQNIGVCSKWSICWNKPIFLIFDKFGLEIATPEMRTRRFRKSMFLFHSVNHINHVLVLLENHHHVSACSFCFICVNHKDHRYTYLTSRVQFFH